MARVRTRLGGSLGILILLILGWLLLPELVITAVSTVLYHPVFPFVLIGLYAIRPFFAWPIVALSTVVGYRYGLVIGLPIALAGAVGTSLIPFTIARTYNTDTGLLGRFTTGSKQFFDTTGAFRGVLAARLAPTPAEAVSSAAGLANIPFGVFVLATVIGELPWTIAAVIVGQSIHELTQTTLTISHPWLIIGGTLAALILLANPLYTYLKHTHTPP